MTKIEIVLCVLLGVALAVGLVSAFAEIAAVPSVSLLCAVGLGSILVVKNGIPLGYIYSKSTFDGNDFRALRAAVESLQVMHQKTSEQLLSIQKRCLVQGAQITLSIETQNQANREQIRSIQDLSRRSTELEGFRDEFRKVKDWLEK
nr:hypothetical protein [Glutamicibacter nicotianae]